MAQQPTQNPKTQGTEKKFDKNGVGSNNPVKKEQGEKRDTREESDKANKNMGSQKYRDPNADIGKDQSAR